MIRRAAALILALLGATACAPLIREPGPPNMTAQITESALRAADGALLPMRSWIPAAAPSAVVLALHGFNDYSNAFTGPGAFLAAHGIAVYAYDQRGFGAAPHHGEWAGTAAMTGDLRTAANILRARHPDLPLYLLGESMGGAVAVAATAGDDPPPVDGLILAAPAVWGRETMPWYQTASLWIAAHTVPWLKLSGRGLNRRPSDNVPMLRALGRDPRIITNTRIDSVHGLVDLMDAALAGSADLPLPVLALYGAHDEIIPPEPTRRAWARMAGTANHRFALYADGWHMLLRDVQAVTVWRDIAAWIENPRAALPSGADGRARERLAALSGP